MAYNAWFQCINGCPGEFDLREVIYRCPTCGDRDAASRVVDACGIPHIAASLGGVESLIEQPANMSFYEPASEEQFEIGIKDNLIRYAVGIEDADDLIADLGPALDRAFADG